MSTDDGYVCLFWFLSWLAAFLEYWCYHEISMFILAFLFSIYFVYRYQRADFIDRDSSASLVGIREVLDILSKV